ncbi:hypothetical protein A1O1_03250 [Capronia coronata CBS 617.96]|uniref:C2 domain-containing protein n=1 Tax=Capronia coronata CBS 617.96 TaxID=1182541 RepID=W9YPN3_9EURO|nr:uncharacterized protein A1O1_03250 [Capronia coronata CBS 617.96]EXJ94852.1 hypothetical protein A1O1_03250 [Capronia coronata CBS 617.96]
MAVRSRAVNAAHTAGIFADMTLDGPEIGTLVAVVDRAKNLPNRKTMGKQDPYCAMRLGKEAKKTNTDKRGGQTPKWDQELRFTVHDSPDYYKLKCSIFNDDKKTDLIGEAWIDLHEVIVAGGGQNDLWHQLNFKGKYAGDVRVELTYYDTRPLPELSSGKKKQRDKAHSIASDAASTASTSRQLGPREIKRRPLPPGPGGYSSPTTQSPEPWPSEDPATNTWPGREYTNSHPPPRPPKQRIPETPDDVGYDFYSDYESTAYDPPSRSRGRNQQRPSSHEYYEDLNRMGHQPNAPNSYPIDPYEPDDMRSGRISLSHQTGGSPGRIPTDIAPADSSRNISSQAPYQSSPTSPLPSSPSIPSQPQPWQKRSSTSPTKHGVYRDSPLRQSVTHVDLLQPEMGYPDPRFDEDERPPPPPAHRDHVPKMPVVSAPYPSPHGHPAPQTPLKYNSVEEKSPLQKLEREYDPYQRSTPPAQGYPQANPLSSFDQRLPADCDGYDLPPAARHSSHDIDMMQYRPRPSANDAPLNGNTSDRSRLQQSYTSSPQHDFRQSAGYGPPRRAHTFDTSLDASDDGQLRTSYPIVNRPRAISPGLSPMIPRKSITPTPAESRSSVGAVPYSPDSYDVLNPGQSPTVDGSSYATPEQLRETARQREIQELRDQGPIIGNDGRVIDPSDHLPADTWAPEPERKDRMPEHVIRIRTKEETRLHNRGGSLPSSARPPSMTGSPFQPQSPTALPSAYQSSPSPTAPSVASPPPSESSNGRNRLRKQIPTRPLPTQPFAHPQSSPAVFSASSTEGRPSPSSQRYTISSSPSAPGHQRPSLSEYQVPATNSYGPQGAPPLAEPYAAPTNAPLSRPRNSADAATYGRDRSFVKAPFYEPENSKEYRGYGFDQPRTQAPLSGPVNSIGHGGYSMEDSLALELSTIDIGPSRTGRTAVRPVRGYGGY